MRARALVATAALLLLLAGCGSSTPSGAPTATFSARPVLCYAPLYQPSATAAPAAGAPLPTCGPSYQLTRAHLDVKLDTSTYAGYTANLRLPPDPQFASYPSTPRAQALPSHDVLLPGAPSDGEKVRYVLGPATLSAASVRTALAYDEGGLWVDNIVFTSQGSAAWDALSKQQFHALVAFVVNGRVLVASVIEPTQRAYSPSGGVTQLYAGLTEQQAKQLASELP